MPLPIKALTILRTNAGYLNAGHNNAGSSTMSERYFEKFPELFPLSEQKSLKLIMTRCRVTINNEYQYAPLKGGRGLSEKNCNIACLASTITPRKLTFKSNLLSLEFN